MPERAQQLRDAAVRLFVEHGYRDIDVDDIVAACDVSRGTFYNSYRSKRDLLSVILARVFDDLAVSTFSDSDWSVVTERDSFVSEFRTQLRRGLQHIADNAELLSFAILTAPGIDADALTSLVAGYRRIAAQVTEVLEIATQRGWIRSDVPIDLVWAGQLVTSTVATSATPLLLSTDEAFDVDEVADFTTNFLLGGTRAVLSHP
ncbi:MAG: TetR/AcrR family transcriptional regulator [Mycobacterium sp.]|nr:TetR/AcrR family transcriptional regulator [Mycobacterium sp.]